MSKQEPQKMPLKGSALGASIVAKLGRTNVINSNAPGFGSKPEPVTLVRHLMWAVGLSQKKAKLQGSVIEITSIAEVLKLTENETEAVVTFLQQALGTTFSRIYR